MHVEKQCSSPLREELNDLGKVFSINLSSYYFSYNIVIFRSLDELICNNADYLMDSISLRLRHFQQNKKCPLVLKIMLQYSSSELLPLIDDTIQEVLRVKYS